MIFELDIFKLKCMLFVSIAGIKQFLQVDTDQVDQKIPETKQVEV